MNRYPLKKLRKIIDSDLVDIHDEYVKASKAEEPNEKQKWLIDNYYLLEKEAKQVRKELMIANAVNADESGLPVSYSAFFRLLPDGKLPTNDSIVRELGKYDLSVCEIELIALMLKAALISRAAQGSKETSQLFSNCVRQLNSVNDIDFSEYFLLLSEAEKILEADTAYSESTDKTKAYYRNRLAIMAKKQELTEKELSQLLADKSLKDGVSICELLESDNEKKGKAQIAVEIILPLAVSVAICVLVDALYLILPLWVALWECTGKFITEPFLFHVPARFLPQKEISCLPDSAFTVVTVISLLASAENTASVKNNLKNIYLTEKDENLRVCLLADLKAASSEKMPEDKVNIDASKKMIDELNAQYGNHFMLFIRNRAYCRTQSNYQGVERKRGAVEELVRVISEKCISNNSNTQFLVMHGAVKDVEKAKYIMALDSDTQLTVECVKALVSTALHPMNKPVTDEKKRIVKKGYGVLVPVVETSVSSAYKTGFSVLLAGLGGVSSYDENCSERYQNYFGSSTFTGKGLIDVSAYYKLLCDRFKPERILSHDIIEGEILRCGFVCSSFVTDNFPSGENSYFARLHRWVRGDCQNAGFIKNNTSLYATDEKNTLGFVSKYKLFDNIRRAVTPVVALILILVCVLLPDNICNIMLWLAVVAVTADEIAAFVRMVFSPGRKSLIYHCYGDALPEAMLAFLRIPVKIIMLVQTAVCCGNALIKAAYRSLISHKNMLEWVTAADSEHGNTTLHSLYKSLLSVISAVWLILFGNVSAIIIAVLFLFDFPFSVLTSMPIKKEKQQLSFLEREKVKSYASAMWNYYETYCNEYSNYLPPDNVQEVPVFRIAERTSPTNIGVMLCSVLAARDMSFITSKEMYERLKRTFDTVIKLKRWHGNLLNWYNTRTLEPLLPQYVSTVDSGNFLCAVTALYEGLKEYVAEYPPLSEIIKRIEGIIQSSDLSVLYNKKRRLFHIGFDLDNNQLTDSYYDLLMSEARMTSYYALAMKQVPKKHWSALSRAMSGVNGYYGPVSWSGTMFEYFMPNMFVPSYRNTLGFDALKFCVYAQKLRTKKSGLPWGVSESGYYRFDAEMNYQYKAHSVSTLALKRDASDELVVSPYSTFLCLPFAKKDSMKNLERLSELSADGECGFYEAIDFSPLRCEGQDYAVVRSYMAHHIGMSLISADNALFDNVMQKRFMSNDNMLSCKSLLNEKIGKNPVSVKKNEKRSDHTANEKPIRQEREFETVSVTNPNVNILSNGEWTTVISDCGTGHGIYRMRNMTRHSADLLRAPLGVFAFVKNKNEIMSAQAATSRNENENHTAVFTDSSAVLMAKGTLFSVKTQVGVHPRTACEIRNYTIKNRTKTTLGGKLCVYFEPSGDFYRNENSHKAFSKLFVTAEKDKNSNVIVFRRQLKDDGGALYCACGFTDTSGFMCNLSREQVLERSDGVFSLNRKRDIPPLDMASVDVCAYVETDFVLAPHSSRKFSFFICTAAGTDELYSRISQIRSQPVTDEKEYARGPFTPGERAMAVFPKLFYETEKTLPEKRAIVRNTADRSVLWRYGISGDNPIIYVESNIGQSLEKVREFVKINRRLRYCGIVTDLIIAYNKAENDNGETDERIRKMMKSEFSNDLVGAQGGVHLIDLANVPMTHQYYFEAVASFLQSKTGDNFILPSVRLNPVEMRIERHPTERKNRMSNNCYEINEKPYLPWSYVISNNTFGTLLSDDSAGFTFAYNSHENKLTKWNNDTRYGNNAELVFLRFGGRCYDLIRSSTVLFGDEKAVYSAVIDETEIKTEITVAERGMRKNIELTLFNTSEKQKQVETAYYCEAELGTGDTDNRFIKAYFRENALELYSTQDTAYTGVMRLGVDCESAFHCLSRKDFFEGKWEERDNTAIYDGCAVLGKRLILPPKRSVKVRFILSYGHFANAAEKVAQLTLPPRKIDNRVLIRTPDSNLDALFNGFLPNQIIDGRLYARCGFYQCGGAYGFRDQLQDVLCVMLTHPRLARNQIARCASAQFEKGDVLHWWHKAGKNKKGIRTGCSDDYLWLAYVACEYAIKTGDFDFLKTEVCYLCGDELSDGENERYDTYRPSETKSTILEHIIKAVEHGNRLGTNSLLLIGSGDWNDGFSKAGEKGLGESVWLTQFYCMVLERTAVVLENFDRAELFEKYRELRKRLIETIDNVAFCNERYIRAFLDDGTVIGAGGAEGAVDSLAQSFAVFCGMPDESRRRSALRTAYDNLVDNKNGVVKLLSPSFTPENDKIGYIADYPSGLRENGGQYTHAAVWLAWALLSEGLTQESFNIMKLLNPFDKYDDRHMAQAYKTEPYYLCGDVYSRKGYEGRGGWSLYTGSAGWYYLFVLNEVLGIKQIDGRLFIKPCLPDEWSGYSATIYLDGAEIELSVTQGGTGLFVDGKRADFLVPDKNDHIVNLQ